MDQWGRREISGAISGRRLYGGRLSAAEGAGKQGLSGGVDTMIFQRTRLLSPTTL
jgi:hypothetical protein